VTSKEKRVKAAGGAKSGPLGAQLTRIRVQRGLQWKTLQKTKKKKPTFQKQRPAEKVGRWVGVKSLAKNTKSKLEGT